MPHIGREQADHPVRLPKRSPPEPLLLHANEREKVQGAGVDGGRQVPPSQSFRCGEFSALELLKSLWNQLRQSLEASAKLLPGDSRSSGMQVRYVGNIGYLSQIVIARPFTLAGPSIT